MSDDAHSLSPAAWRAVAASMDSDPPGDQPDPEPSPELLARLGADHYRATAANRAPRPPQCNPNPAYRKKPAARSSRYRGVCRQKSSGKWVAQISNARAGLRQQNLGLFATEEAAARAYDEAARRLLGGQAPLNFPESPVPAPERVSPGKGGRRVSGWHRQQGPRLRGTGKAR